jgi:hypothetical protein
LFQLFVTGVNDTDGKFAASVVDTGGNLPPAVVDTGGKFDDPNVIIRGLGEGDS